MTRRILLGFLGTLVLVLAALVAPLGIVITGQQDKDFRANARDAAGAVAAVAEEHLDDRAPVTGLTTVVDRFAAGGDRVAVLDRTGGLIASAGVALPAGVLSAVHDGSAATVPEAVVTTSAVRDGQRNLGTVVLVRSREPLDHRHAMLWAALLVAAAATLAVGTAVGVALGRWIGGPVVSLAGAARRFGDGDGAARAVTDAGPPQLRSLAAAFNAMAARITGLLDIQRGMTAEVSHQLRTPLAALRLRLELLGAETEPAHGDEIAAMIGEINRLDRMLDGLLAVARAEAATAVPRPVDLADLVGGRVEAWRPVAEERGVRLAEDARPAVGLVATGHGDQILDNLIDNAIEALPAGGTITVSSYSADGNAVMSVADDGPGMSADRRASATHRFATDRGDSGGTGLGLAIVERLAESNHGSVRLTETPGGGLTVTVTMPAAP